MIRTIVVQSHRQPLPHDWLEPCLQSVRDWAELNRFDYTFLDDELFEGVAESILDKTSEQRIITTDLARLLKLQSLLKQNYECVIWCDADFLIFNADEFSLLETQYALGREVWVQLDRHNRLRAYIKVHNAFMMFRRGNSFLDFYTETAEKLLLENEGGMPPQFIGPKLLTALHNIALCPVQEDAGVLSPLVIRDIIKGGGEVVELFKKKSPVKISSANLCCSSINNGQLSDHEIDTLIQTLLDCGDKMFSLAS